MIVNYGYFQLQHSRSSSNATAVLHVSDVNKASRTKAKGLGYEAKTLGYKAKALSYKAKALTRGKR